MSQQDLLKRLFSSYWMVLAPMWKINWFGTFYWITVRKTLYTLMHFLKKIRRNLTEYLVHPSRKPDHGLNPLVMCSCSSLHSYWNIYWITISCLLFAFFISLRASRVGIISTLFVQSSAWTRANAWLIFAILLNYRWVRPWSMEMWIDLLRIIY